MNDEKNEVVQGLSELLDEQQMQKLAEALNARQLPELSEERIKEVATEVEAAFKALHTAHIGEGEVERMVREEGEDSARAFLSVFTGLSLLDGVLDPVWEKQEKGEYPNVRDPRDLIVALGAMFEAMTRQYGPGAVFFHVLAERYAGFISGKAEG